MIVEEEHRDYISRAARTLPGAAPSQLYADLEWPARLEHGHLDAERRPELADLQAHRQRSLVSRPARPELCRSHGARAAAGRRGRRSRRSRPAALYYPILLAAP